VDSIYETGKSAMEYIQFRNNRSKDTEKQKKDDIKVQRASVGAVTRGREKTTKTYSEEDRRIAGTVGMNVEDYTKNKNVFSEEIPI